MSFKSFYSQFDNFTDVGANNKDKKQLNKVYDDPGNYTEEEITKAYKGAVKIDKDNEYFFDDVGSDDEDLKFKENRHNTAKNTYQTGLNSLLASAKRPSEDSPAPAPEQKPEPEKEEKPKGPVEYSPEIQSAISRVKNYESPFGGSSSTSVNSTENRGYNGFGNANQSEEENKQKQEPQVDPQSFLDKYKMDFKMKPAVNDISVGA